MSSGERGIPASFVPGKKGPDGSGTCIDATKTGEITSSGKIWSYGQMDRSLSTIAIADGLVYAADMPGRVHCLDAETGKCYGVHDCQSDIWTSTLVVDGKVLAGTRKGLFVLAAGRYPQVLAPIRLGTPVRAMPVAANGALRCFTTISLGCRRLAAASSFHVRHNSRASRSVRRTHVRIPATPSEKHSL